MDRLSGEAAPGVNPRWRSGVCLGLAVVAWVLILIPISHRRGEVAIDDVFITYRYAQNLAAGHGFVFNPGEKVFGTTAPGFGLFLGVLNALTGLSIPWLGNILTAVALLSIAMALQHKALANGRAIEAFLGGTLLVGCPYLWSLAGSEIPSALALLVAASLVADKRPGWAGALAGLACWFRPDVLLGAGLLGLALWRQERRLPWRFGLAISAVITTGLGLAVWWFGQPFPATLEAKRTQGALGTGFWRTGWEFWAEGFVTLRRVFTADATMTFVTLGLIGLFLVARHGGAAGRTLTLFAVSLLLAYPLLQVPFYWWYQIPLVIVLLYGFIFAAGGLARSVFRFFGETREAAVLAVVTAAAIFGPTLWTLLARSGAAIPGYDRDSRYALYRSTGEWLAANQRPGDEIAYVEVGTIAFFSQLPIRDLLGLVTPASLPFVRTGDYAGAFLVRPPALLLDSTELHGFVGKITREPWFDAGYQEVREFSHPDGGHRLTLFRRRPDAVLPAPQPPRQIDLPRKKS